jgi:hypothetical protein
MNDPRERIEMAQSHAFYRPSLLGKPWSSESCKLVEYKQTLCLSRYLRCACCPCVRPAWGFVSFLILCASSLPWCTRGYWINKCSKFILYEQLNTQFESMQCVAWACLILTIKLGLFADAFLSFLQYFCNIKRCNDTRTRKRNLPVMCWLTDKLSYKSTMLGTCQWLPRERISPGMGVNIKMLSITLSVQEIPFLCDY